MQSREVWRGLGWAAASRVAGPQAWAQLARSPSGPAVLGHLAPQGTALAALAGPLQALLASLLPQGWGARGCRGAGAAGARP